MNPGHRMDAVEKCLSESHPNERLMNSKILPPTYFWVFLLLSVGLHFLLPVEKIIHPPFAYLGVVLIIFGIILNIWADNIFKKSQTTVKPYETPNSLVVSGPFRISRHPMYLGMVAILLGESILLGSLITLVSPIVFAAIMEVMFIPAEEENMESAFGKEYLDYKKKVRRWI
jgi:protein-S-isoprenylcysteine O-methyltransferase Ste14